MSLLSKLFGRVIQIRIRGAINQRLTRNIYQGLNRATYLPTKAVFININSHQGSLTQAKNICDILANFKMLKKVNIYCFVEDQCTGAANLLLSSADYSYANKMSIMGGFGFTWSNVNLSQWNQKYGVKEQKIAANELQPNYKFFQPLTTETSQFTTHQVERLSFELKKQCVERRKNKITSSFKDKCDWQEVQKIIDSEILTKPAVEAEIMLKYGLIDGIKNSWDILDRQFPKAKLFRIGKPDRVQLIRDGAHSFEGNFINQIQQSINGILKK